MKNEHDVHHSRTNTSTKTVKLGARSVVFPFTDPYLSQNRYPSIAHMHQDPNEFMHHSVQEVRGSNYFSSFKVSSLNIDTL